MPKAICPVCQKEFHGWALLNGDDVCDCGRRLKVERIGC